MEPTELQILCPSPLRRTRDLSDAYSHALSERRFLLRRTCPLVQFRYHAVLVIIRPCVPYTGR